MNITVFKVGDMVVWNIQGRPSNFEAGLVRRFGYGPFRVEAIIPVPASALGNAGHIQWVTLSGSHGHLKDVDLKNPNRFSGAYIKLNA